MKPNLENYLQSMVKLFSVKIIMDRETGRSKGYGFVEMADDEVGDKAIAALNEVDMDGKTLSVSVARPREDVRVVAMATMAVVVIVAVTTVVVVAMVVVAEIMAMAVAETDIDLYLYKI